MSGHEPSARAVLVRNRDVFMDELNAAIDDSERILVVGSNRARNSDAIPPQVLAGRLVQWFVGFSSNPSLASACAAAALAWEFRPSVIVGLGGGSAMDVAKAARTLPTDMAAAHEMMRSRYSPPRIQERPETPTVIAVPTLSGSGAEVTQFATLFDGGRKVSVDNALVRPDIAIINPKLAATAPHLPTSAAILDALCHAVESTWSRSATIVSWGHSEKALQHLAPVRWKTDGAYSLDDRYMVAEGALSAGLAINLTRTTAAHAAAYMLTTSYGIPHGVACALNMQWVARINLTASAMAPEAVATVEGSLDLVMTDLPEYFRHRLFSAGWPARLRDYGVDRGHLSALASDATHQARMRNNPVDLTAADVENALSTIF